METIENKVNKAYEDNKAIIEIARKAEEAHAKYAKVIEQVSKQEKTKKRDVLLYLLSGRPTSMLIALQKFGVGSYRDVIYDLRQEGWKISHYDEPTSSKTFFSIMVPLALVDPFLRE